MQMQRIVCAVSEIDHRIKTKNNRYSLSVYVTTLYQMYGLFIIKLYERIILAVKWKIRILFLLDFGATQTISIGTHIQDILG